LKTTFKKHYDLYDKNRSSQPIRKPARAHRKKSRHDTTTLPKMKNPTPTSKPQTQVKHSQDTPKPEHNTTHKTRWTQNSNTQRSQQHKTNMANHRSLKHTLLQAEIQKNSEKQHFTHSDSKKKQQSDSQSKTFSQHEQAHFKHTRIYTQVQRGKPKEHPKNTIPIRSNERTATQHGDSKQH